MFTNCDIQQGLYPNSFRITENEKDTVGEIRLIVDTDGVIEVNGTFKSSPFYYLITREKGYFYIEDEKNVIIYDIEAFKKDVFKKIKEA